MATNQTVTLLTSAARTASVNGDDQLNHRHRGVVVSVKATASASTPSVVFKVQGRAATGDYYDLLESAAVTGAGAAHLTVYPGVTVASNTAASAPLPKTWRVIATAADSDSLTYSVTATLLV